MLKWSRLIGPTGPRDFGFVTFEHGVSGLRCFRVLSELTLDELRVFVPKAAEPLQIKSGTKERAVLESMTHVCNVILLLLLHHYFHIYFLFSYMYPF